MKQFIFFLFSLFSLCSLQAQVTVTCGVTSNICYPDPNNCALNNNYPDNTTYTETYTSSDGTSNLEIVFTSFDVETNFDFLYIYDDASANDPNKLVATYTGTTLPASILSTGTSLTLKFVSDGSVNQQGFKATIACFGNQAPTLTKLSPADGSSNNAGNTDLILTFSEIVNPVAGKFIEIRTVGTNALIEQIDAGSANVTGGGTNTITINPSTNLPTGANYVLIDVGAFQDIANADFAGFANVNDWVFNTRTISFDGFAGKSVQFTEVANQPNTYAEVPHNTAFNLQDEFTIEFWVKLDKLKQDQKLIGKADLNPLTNTGYVIGIKDNKLSAEFWDTQGKPTKLEGGIFELNKWEHIAITWSKTEGKLIAYQNGDTLAVINNLTESWGVNSNPLRIGVAPWDVNAFPMDGQIDEIRIWSKKRTPQEIRENIYLTLIGDEPNLTSYWQCNDADNSILKDEKGLFHAALFGASTKVSSSLPVGAGISETQNIQSLFAGLLNFPNANLELNVEIYNNIDLLATADIVVSKITGKPNPNLSDVIAPYATNFWIIRKYGTGVLDASPTFKFNNFLKNADIKSDISLFKRAPQSHLDWDFVATGTDISFANQNASFGDYTDYNMQFAISRGNARQLDSLALVALYNATDGANWITKWNLNTPMTSWFGVEIENRRVVKLQLYENNLVGVLPLGLDVLSELRIMNLRTNSISGTIPSDLGNLFSLQVLNLRFNLLEGTVPSSFGNLTQLTNLILSQNFLEDLPSFRGAFLGNLQLLAVHSNKFTFEDIVDNVGIFPDFDYQPQQRVNDTLNIQTVEGANVIIKTTVAGTGNQYQWFKDGDSLTQKSLQSSHTIQNFSGQNIGVYHCEITNTGAPDLILLRNPITITTTLNQTDSLSLVALYNATDGANWKYKWDLTMPINTWFGIKLINNSRVQEVKLAGNNLVGTLPNELGNLTEMINLDLGSNTLSGAIPSTLGKLTKMRFLFLHNNELTGTIPSELSDMQNAEIILVRGNKLTGDLPNSFINLSKLRRLEIQGNELTGLPTFPRPNKLEELSVENNKLTFADIEANIGITADFNYFPQGEIDTSLSLSEAWMSDVTFTTTVDGTQNSYQWKKGINNIDTASTANTFTIKELDYPDAGIYTCEVTNSLVPGLVLVRRAITLEINPPGINQTDSLALIALYNSTNGANWQVTWDLQDEVLNWSGVTVKNGRVTKLNLSSNRLIGTLPVELGNISRLEELNLQSNTISGKMLAEIGNLTQLKQLNLSLNKLTGEVPSSFEQLTALQNLDLHNNKLSGEIPAFWAKTPNLMILHFKNNELRGTIPDEIGLLTELVELDLGGNELIGDIPQNFTELHELQLLSLESNSFDHLPNLQDLDHLSQLNVSNNLFTFEDLEPNIGLFPVFEYKNQRVRDALDTLVNLGDDIVLNEIVDGSANTYQWFKDNQKITLSSPQSSLTLVNVNFDSIAVYTVKVSNSLVSNLILSYDFNLKVKPETPHVITPEPYCYGDTVIVLTAQGGGGTATRWYSDAGLNLLLGENTKIRVSLTQDRQTFYAINLASGLESKAEEVEIILRPTIEKQGNTLFVADEGINYQWHFNREIIKGDTSHILTIKENGSGDGIYSVTIFTKEGCEATSKNVEIKGTQLLTALEDDILTNDLRIYPNPSQDILNIALNNTYFGDLKIKIINYLGKELIVSELQKNSQELNTNIDISNLPSGLYILELNTDKGTFTRKIIKQ